VAPADDGAELTEQATVTCNDRAQPFGGGDGTVGSPFLVCAADQLVHLGDAPTQAHYRLARDIDLTGTPIRSITRFVGVLDGAGRTIKGLFADGTNGQGAWIGEQRGHIKNLRITGAHIDGVALLAARNFGVVESSDFEGDVVGASTWGAGGVVAQNLGLVSNVRVNGNIAGTSSVGGVVGTNTGLGRVVHSFFDGTVTGGSRYIGGIAGVNEGVLLDVHAKGSVLTTGAVGLGAGGIAGWQGGVIDVASADVTTYTYDSAGGLVGRAKGGKLSRAFAKGKVHAHEAAGGIVGLVEFGAAIEDAYALVDVTVDHSGAKAFGDYCARCFFHGTVAGAAVSDVSPGPAGADLADPATFAAFGDAWDVGATGSLGRPRLAWEASPPGAPPIDFVAVQLSVYNPSRPPKTLVFRETATQIERQGAFGRAAGSPWIHAVVYVPPGEHTYAVNKRDDGFWGGYWCDMTTSPSSGPWTATRTMTVGTTAIHDQSLWIRCPEYSGDDWPEHPGPGQYMSALSQGAPLLYDDAEGTTVPWELIGLWRRVTSTPCVSPSAASGVGAFYYGDPNGCYYYPNVGSVGIAWMTSPPIAGVVEGSTIEFDSYRDFGENDETAVVVFPQGAERQVDNDYFQKKVWSRRGPHANDRGWEHVTIRLPRAWFYGLPVRFRFAVKTYGPYHHDRKGWLVDNVKITR
jgi:hypothetical protein